jgi:branched-chain amino acid transport system permease protein
MLDLEIIEPVVNGLLLGALYAVIGMGLSMIFGIVRQVNLAHGELMILASYISLVVTQYMGLNPLLSLIIVVPVMFVIGYMLQSILFNRVLDKGMEPYLIISFGLSVILQNAMLLVFTPDARTLDSSLSLESINFFGLFRISSIYLVNCVSAVLVFTLVHQFMRRSFSGQAIRAAADNRTAARLVGIDTKRTHALAMGIAATTAGVAGVLVGMTFTFYPQTGTQYLIIAFGVVIIGGLGSLPGTLLGGAVLGVSQLLGARLLGPGFQLLSGYLILLLVLTVRPQGILGKGE